MPSTTAVAPYRGPGEWRRRRSRRVVAAAVAAAVGLVTPGLLAVVVAPAAVAAVPFPVPDEPGLPTSTAAVTKTASVGDDPVRPGEEFTYELTATCSDIRTDCVDYVVQDVIPDGLEVTSLPPSLPPERVVTYDPVTRVLQVEINQPLDDPAGREGLPAGSPVQLQVGVRLPADTGALDGDVIANTAEADAANTTLVSDGADVTVEVPREAEPVATKAWGDASLVAGSGGQTVVTLGVRNRATTSAEVTELAVTEDTESTFEHFDLTTVTLARFPEGADEAVLRVLTADGWVEATPTTATGPLDLPPGVDPADVLGVDVVFRAADGSALPRGADGGEVQVGLGLRDTTRSDGQPLRPTEVLTVDNCAAPRLVEEALGEVAGTPACDSIVVLPDVLVLDGAKSFYPDSDGDYAQEPGEFATIGVGAGVSASIDLTNDSPFPVESLTISEPSTSGVSEPEKVAFTEGRVRLPDGTTGASIVIRYSDGTSDTLTVTEDTSFDAPGGLTVTGVTATFTGEGPDGEASIAAGATGGLDLHGTLTDAVTEADLPGGASPGVPNCADVAGDAGRVDGSGTAAGTACDTLQVELPRYAGDGTKSVGQDEVPPGQPVPFEFTVANASNAPIPDPVVSDPRVGPDGRPDPSVPNPFDVLRITDVEVGTTGAVSPYRVELFDPRVDAWVAYSTDPALLDAARGVRVAFDGPTQPGSTVTVRLTTERREGVPDGARIVNCISTGTAVRPDVGDPACSPAVTTAPASSGASLGKSISPGTLPIRVPGLPPQVADVTLTVVNTGNVSARELAVTDDDADFFDAVDFVRFDGVRKPDGADLVQVDALVGGAWVLGTPRASAALPARVTPDDVRGLRVRFTASSSANDGYLIVPCERSACRGRVTFEVTPRDTLVSDPTTPVPRDLADTVAGEYLTRLQADGVPQPIAPDTATLQLVEGTPGLDVEKTPDSVVAPGEVAPFRLTVTNTGTDDVNGLVVRDLLPEGIAADLGFVGDRGEPFRVVDTDVPDGTPPVPHPVLTVVQDGERVSELRFDFGTDDEGRPWVLAPGATLTIEIRVTLEPGVRAGQVVSNSVGASSADPDLACAGTVDTDGAYGPGTWCTDTADLTAAPGAAFTARKWVAGTEARGWLDQRTGATVPVGDPACPRATDSGGRVYTASPCIALVDPGDRFHYLLRLRNAGTEPGTAMRVVDRFPVPGDTAVLSGQDRGTAWDRRPVLASEPVLEGAGSLATLYTTSEPVCTDDLAMGGAGSSAPTCPASAWDDPYGPDAVAAQFRVAFPEPLRPGGTVSVLFDMQAPVDVPRVADPTVAWNSYAHAETTDRDGRPNVLPPTEPLRVGVATLYGDLRVVKTIGDNPAGLPLATTEFPVRVTCAVTPDGGATVTVLDRTVTVRADAPATLAGIPAGARCEVVETDALGGVPSATVVDPVVVVVEPSAAGVEAQVAEVRNDFPLTTLEVGKVATGGAAGSAPETVAVDVTCTFDGEPVAGWDPRRVAVPTGGTTAVPVPSGTACRVLEAPGTGAASTTYDPVAAVPSVAGAPGSVTVTNDYPSGGLVVLKEVRGAGAADLGQGPFDFEVVCAWNGDDEAVRRTVTIPAGDGTATTFRSDPVTGLPDGAQCLVTETGDGGADSTPGPVSVTVVRDQVTPVAFVGDGANVFSAGTLGLAKVVDGPGAGAPAVRDAVFVLAVTCQVEVDDGAGGSVRATALSADVEIRGGERVDALTAPDGDPLLLPVGTHCWATETETGGATSSVVDATDWESAVVVTARPDPTTPQALRVTATNTFAATVVDGDGAPLAQTGVDVLRTLLAGGALVLCGLASCVLAARRRAGSSPVAGIIPGG